MKDDQIYRKLKKGGNEIDAFSPWARKFYCWGRGIIKDIKKGSNRRIRRQAKQELKKGSIETDD